MPTEERRHEEIMNLYIQQLAYIWMEDSTTETARASVEKKIDSFVEDGLEHATEMLSALWEIVNKDGDIKAPANTSSAVSQFQCCLLPRVMLTSHHQATQATSPAHWDSVKTALIRSIRKGVFFDRKYWARRIKTGDVLKPIYFSSTIMEDKSEQLSKRALRFGQGFIEVLKDPSG